MSSSDEAVLNAISLSYFRVASSRLPEQKQRLGATRARTWVLGTLKIRIPSDNHYTIAPLFF